jgi:hypothetical protein
VKLDTPVASDMGIIGVLKTGGFVFNHLAGMNGEIANHVENEKNSLDSCHGHADQ